MESGLPESANALSLYTEIARTESYEAVEAMRPYIIGSSDIINEFCIELSENVFLHYVNEAEFEDDPDKDFPDRYILIRERKDLAGRIQTIDGHEVVPIQVLASISRSLTKESPGIAHKWLSATHKRIFQAVNNKKPSLILNTMSLPYQLQDRPSTADLDPVDQTEWYSTALYYAVIQPIE